MKKIIAAIVRSLFIFTFAPFFFIGYVIGLLLSPLVLGLKDGFKEGSEQTRDALRKVF